MINIFINEEYGYRHFWWEYPGTLDDLVVDWNSGNVPFAEILGRGDIPKPYQGTLTELPIDFNSDNPFAALTAGRRGTYTLCRPGEDPEEKSCVSMEDFFQASMETCCENPHLRIGDEIYPMAGDLLYDEQEIADSFSWADWTEDPAYYRQWFEEWKASYRCGQDRTAEIADFYWGKLSPQASEQLASHINACQDCKQQYIDLRTQQGGRWSD